MNATLDERQLPDLLDRFYARVRTDSLLGPLFNDAVHDWPHHLERLRDFWSSVSQVEGRQQRLGEISLAEPLAAGVKCTQSPNWLCKIGQPQSVGLVPSGPNPV
mgnify:CR=1 FL=1